MIYINATKTPFFQLKSNLIQLLLTLRPTADIIVITYIHDISHEALVC